MRLPLSLLLACVLFLTSPLLTGVPDLAGSLVAGALAQAASGTPAALPDPNLTPAATPVDPQTDEVAASRPPSDEALTPEPATPTPSANPSPSPVSNARPATSVSRDSVLLLNVPYRSQFDGSPYANANCGPTSLAMVLEAYGVPVPTERLRELANEKQGSAGYSDGVALETLRSIAAELGLRPEGLYEVGGQYARWTVESIQAQVARGRPVITLVHYRSLPGNESSTSSSDHYVVVVGHASDGVFVHDPAFEDRAGRLRFLTSEELREAWAAASVAGQAVAFGPGDGQLPLAVAPLLRSELSALAAPTVAAIPSATPAPPEQTPPTLATATQPIRRSATPTRTPVPNRWARSSALPTRAPTAPPARPEEPREPTEILPDDTLVLATTVGERPNHLAAVGIALGLGAIAGVVLVRRPERARAHRRPSSTVLWMASAPPGAPSSPSGVVASRLAVQPITLPLVPDEAPAPLHPVEVRRAESEAAASAEAGDHLWWSTSGRKLAVAALVEALAVLPDPRRRRRYALASIVALAACAVVEGAESERAAARWAAGCSGELLRSVGISGPRAPSPSTVARVFRAIDGEALERALRTWASQTGYPAPDRQGPSTVATPGGAATERP